MAAAVAEKGYRKAGMADVVMRGRVTPETFYEHFEDKDECFLAALDEWSDRVLARVLEASAAAKGNDARMLAAIEAFLNSMAEDPHYAKLAVVESLAAGPRALASRAHALRRLLPLLTVGHLSTGPDSLLPPLLTEAVHAGITGIVYQQISMEGAETLPPLVDGLHHFARAVFAGHRTLSRGIGI